MTDTRMPSVMLQTKRESLGLTIETMANLLMVNPRTVRAWESGRDLIPERIREEVEAIEDFTQSIIDALAEELEEDGQAYLVVVRHDEEFAELHPEEAGAGYTARWFRHLASRLTVRVPGLELVSPDEFEAVIEEAAEASLQERQGRSPDHG